MENYILSTYIEKYIHKKVLFETVPITNALFLDINNFLIFFLSSRTWTVILEMKALLYFTSRKIRINTFVKLNNNNLWY